MTTTSYNLSQKQNNHRVSPKKLAFAAAGAVLLAICSWINIPTTVPFTLQTFGVFLLLMLLGGKMATLSILVYILLGALGVPVFAGFSGGLGILFGSTGGYIMGFLLMGALYIFLVPENCKDLKKEVVVLLLGLFVCYLFGTFWFMFVYTKANGAVGFTAVLSWCVIPFIIPDLVKMVLAVVIAGRLKPVLAKL